MALKQMTLNEIKELITKNEFPKAIAELDIMYKKRLIYACA